MAPDKEPIPFSFMTEQIWLPPEQQVANWIYNIVLFSNGKQHL